MVRCYTPRKPGSSQAASGLRGHPAREPAQHPPRNPPDDSDPPAHAGQISRSRDLSKDSVPVTRGSAGSSE
jgi:hypothetical protein